MKKSESTKITVFYTLIRTTFTYLSEKSRVKRKVNATDMDELKRANSSKLEKIGNKTVKEWVYQNQSLIIEEK